MNVTRNLLPNAIRIRSECDRRSPLSPASEASGILVSNGYTSRDNNKTAVVFPFRLASPMSM